MNETGQMFEWNDERGFGFVHTIEGERLFVHIKSIEPTVRRPLVGDVVVFRRGPGRDGRPAATAARIEGLAAHSSGYEVSKARALTARALRLAGAAILLAVLLLARNLDLAPGGLLWVYLLMGAVSALLYAIDKGAARAGTWRIAEKTLHGVDFFGGIIGGLLAQTAFHHKTGKVDFALLTLAVYLIHMTGLAALIFGFFDVPAIPH